MGGKPRIQCREREYDKCVYECKMKEQELQELNRILEDDELYLIELRSKEESLQKKFKKGGGGEKGEREPLLSQSTNGVGIHDHSQKCCMKCVVF